MGGPIGLIHDGDMITIDAEKRIIEADVTEQEFEKRKLAWKAPPYKAKNGTLFKFIKTVNSFILKQG